MCSERVTGRSETCVRDRNVRESCVRKQERLRDLSS